MGVATDWEDYVTRSLRFTPTQDTSSEGVLRQKRWIYKAVNDLVIGVNFNFFESITENEYRPFGEQISLLGGFIAAIYASLWILSPLVVFYFLL